MVEEESGVSSFTALQEVLKSGRSDRMVFCAFNLLYLGGYDLTQVPLFDPKTLLAGCLDELPAGGSIRFSEHIETDGKAMLQKACRLGLGLGATPLSRATLIGADLDLTPSFARVPNRFQMLTLAL